MYNSMTIAGFVRTDPQMAYTPNNTPVTTFSVPINRRYTDADGIQQEETEWFRVTAWNRLAEYANENLERGMTVLVEGRLRSNQWEASDGKVRFSNEIHANTICRLPPFPQSIDGASSETKQSWQPASGRRTCPPAQTLASDKEISCSINIGQQRLFACAPRGSTVRTSHASICWHCA